jgi:tripartite-type tricarboxylate transporter receptor subunit TctC
MIGLGLAALRWVTRSLCALALAVVASLVPAPLAAASFPSKPVRLIVPFPPGAFNDQLARTLSQKLGAGWKQPVIVDNRPGGSTVIGTELAARAPADGHTLLIVSFAFAVNPSLFRTLPFDTARDFTPVVLAAGAPNVLVVHPDVKARTVSELIRLARERRGGLDYATGGNGTSNHLCSELFQRMAGVKLVHVAYKGSAPALTDLIGGQVQVMFDNAPNVLPHVRAGKLRALAVSTASRSAFAPELPTVAETVPGFDVEVWFGVVAPAGVPRDVIEKLNADINRVLALPEVKGRFAEQGVRVIGGSPEQFGIYLQVQMRRWAQVVKDAGLQVE